MMSQRLTISASSYAYDSYKYPRSLVLLGFAETTSLVTDIYISSDTVGSARVSQVLSRTLLLLGIEIICKIGNRKEGVLLRKRGVLF
jgi:hypothetical protein